MSFTNIGKSCPTCEFLSSQLCLLMLFTKIKIITKISEFTVVQTRDNSQKPLILQTYIHVYNVYEQRHIKSCLV